MREGRGHARTNADAHACMRMYTHIRARAHARSLARTYARVYTHIYTDVRRSGAAMPKMIYTQE